MAEVFEINTRKTFTLEELDHLLPVVRKITSDYVERVQEQMKRFEAARARNDEAAQKLEKEVNDTVYAWQTKLEKLGAKPKGLWLADFDSGDGFYCWKYPEDRVMYWHHYSDGFRGRKLIEREREKSPIQPSPDL